MIQKDIPRELKHKFWLLEIFRSVSSREILLGPGDSTYTDNWAYRFQAVHIKWTEIYYRKQSRFGKSTFGLFLMKHHSCIKFVPRKPWLKYILSWGRSIIVKSTTKSNMFKGRWKTKDLNFVFTDVLVSLLR